VRNTGHRLAVLGRIGRGERVRIAGQTDRIAVPQVPRPLCRQFIEG
jgi:hypothetical protein